MILQTLLKRTDLLHNMDWTKDCQQAAMQGLVGCAGVLRQVDIIDYENFLQLVKMLGPSAVWGGLLRPP